MGTISLKPHNCTILHHFPKLPSSIRPHQLLSLPSCSISKSISALPSLSLSSAMASASSAIGATDKGLKGESSGIVGERDLLIVGPGVLGRLVAQQWREEFPGCQVYGQTMTIDHHEELAKLGINPSLKETKPLISFLMEAALSWNGEGCFLFTSSSAPYDCFNNGQCDEDSSVVPIGKSPRTDILLKAEKVVLEHEGSVLRLAGLYKEDKGAHVYWLDKGTVDVRPDHILNLIHYEDAASLSVAILKKKFRSRIFLGCDNHPVSRQEIMDLVAKSGKFNQKFEAFIGTSDPLGKRLNNSKTRQEVGWELKYPSFAHFLGVSH